MVVAFQSVEVHEAWPSQGQLTLSAKALFTILDTDKIIARSSGARQHDTGRVRSIPYNADVMVLKRCMHTARRVFTTRILPEKDRIAKTPAQIAEEILLRFMGKALGSPRSMKSDHILQLRNVNTGRFARFRRPQNLSVLRCHGQHSWQRFSVHGVASTTTCTTCFRTLGHCSLLRVLVKLASWSAVQSEQQWATPHYPVSFSHHATSGYHHTKHKPNFDVSSLSYFSFFFALCYCNFPHSLPDHSS